MKYAAAFTFFVIALAYLAADHGGFAWLLLWPALGFLIVAAGYGFLGSRVMGKRPDGTFAWWSRIILLPFRVFVFASWWAGKLVFRESACDEVAPALWVGRRPNVVELPIGTTLIIDLTSEFADTRSVRRSCAYLCVPTLDASVPDEAACLSAIDRIAATSGPVYIHCAQGHGRSGTVAAIVLIRRGLAADVDDAVRVMTSSRPRVRLNRRQRAFVQKMSPANT